MTRPGGANGAGRVAVKQLSLFEPIPITLATGHIAHVDIADMDLTQIRWYAWVDDTRVYVASKQKVDGKRRTVYLHRLVLERKIGRALLKAELADHIDGNPLNNTRDNLRVSTGRENQYNTRRSKNNTSGYKGVSWDKKKGKWISYIRIKGLPFYLGAFDTPKSAHEAYCKAAKETRGEFARTE